MMDKIQQQMEQLKLDYEQQAKQLKELYKERQAELEEQLKQERAKERLFIPKEGENYWFVYGDGSVGCCLWVGCPDDENRFSLGNCYKTQTETNFVSKKLLVDAELRRFVLTHDPRPITKEDWKDQDLRKYYMTCRTRNNDIEIDYTFNNKRANQIYASDANTLRKAIQTIGMDKVLKYHFEVKNND